MLSHTVKSKNCFDQRRHFFRIINQGEEAWRLTLGASPKVLQPGFRIAIPLLHEVRRVDMREVCTEIKALNAYTKDNVPVSLDGSLYYKATDSYKTCFAVQDAQESIRCLGTSVARRVIGNFDYDNIVSDRNHINKMLHDTLDGQCDNWGVNITRFEIQDFSPQNSHIKKQLELQMEAERKRRENDLNTKATIRSAEGEKDSRILEFEGKKKADILEAEGKKEAAIIMSEGELEAQKNRAEADLFLQIKKADAERYRIEAEAEAKKREIELLKECIGIDGASVAHFIIARQKAENIGKIAEGNGNSTYFLPLDIVNVVKEWVLK